MYLKILAHPVFVNLNFHMPMIVDLSHPLIMLTGENGSGKSTLLHSIHYALKGEKVDGFIYRLDAGKAAFKKVFLFDAEHFFFSSRRRHTSSLRDWSSDVCSSD